MEVRLGPQKELRGGFRPPQNIHHDLNGWHMSIVVEMNRDSVRSYLAASCSDGGIRILGTTVEWGLALTIQNPRKPSTLSVQRQDKTGYKAHRCNTLPARTRGRRA